MNPIRTGTVPTSVADPLIKFIQYLYDMYRTPISVADLVPLVPSDPPYQPGFRIRIDLMDPAFFLIADPDSRSRIRIQCLMT